MLIANHDSLFLLGRRGDAVSLAMTAISLFTARRPLQLGLGQLGDSQSGAASLQHLLPSGDW